MTIGWYEPKFGEREKELVNSVLDSGYVSEGSLTKELERELKDFIGVKHVILMTSGTAALFLALKADQVIRGLDSYEVIIPDFTCIATASAVRLAGATPVLVDIDRTRHTINVEDVKRKITDKTRAIIPVQVLGRTSDMNKLEKIAIEKDLTIIEDASGALSSSYYGEHLGTFGKVGTFSLQANKIISCGQGGFIVTNDDSYNEIIRRIKDQGRLEKSEFVYPIEGYNFKFNDILAAVALGQMEEIEKRRLNLINQRGIYEKELRGVEEVLLPKIMYGMGEVPSWVDAVVERRDELAEYLSENEIATRRGGWPPVHRNGAYPASDEDFPIASYVSDHGLWLPNGPKINPEQINRVCKKIKEFYSK